LCGRAMRIVGIDLAWGDRKPDGLALIEASPRGGSTLQDTGYVSGDEALVSWVRASIGSGPALLALDGPIVCENAKGARPVDWETHRLFGRAHAGCYPANLTRCPRPNGLRLRLEARDFVTDFEMQEPRQVCAEEGKPFRRLIEVYPHPAMLALFDLNHIIRYKKGAAAERGRELTRFQLLLRESISRSNPAMQVGERVRALFEEDPAALRGAARKRHEDMLDAIVCALVGWIHWWHGGRCSQVLGDLHTGFIVVPERGGGVRDTWTTS
jgi:predicted RNase H-like nuclease